MRFGTQQWLLCGVPSLVLFVSGNAEKFGFSEEAFVIPEAARILMGLVAGFAFYRFFFWLAWTSTRGDKFLQTIGLSRDRILNGFGSGFLRWYCHVDADGRER